MGQIVILVKLLQVELFWIYAGYWRPEHIPAAWVISPFKNAKTYGLVCVVYSMGFPSSHPAHRSVKQKAWKMHLYNLWSIL